MVQRRLNGHRTDTTGVLSGGRLPRGGALFFFDRPLALDAVAGKGKRLQALLRDRLPAPFAIAEITLFELFRSGADFFEEAPVAVAELEEEFAVVRRRSLISQVLGGVVFRTLGVEDGFAHAFDKLAVLLFQLLLELRQTLLPHRCLLRDTAGSGRSQWRRLPRPPGEINGAR